MTKMSMLTKLYSLLALLALLLWSMDAAVTYCGWVQDNAAEQEHNQ